MARKTESKAPKAGTKGAAARRKTTTPLGNTRAIDDNSFSAPKAKPRQSAVSLAEALAESGESIEDLKDHSVPAEADRPTRPAGTSNLANTIRSRRKQYQIALGANGKKTQTCGDSVALALLHIPLPALKAFVQSREPGKNYDQLNSGHQRMCYGNKVRAWAKQDDQTTLLWLQEAQVRSEDQPKQDADPQISADDTEE